MQLAMDKRTRQLAVQAKGFMPDEQGMLLYRIACDVLKQGDVAVEIGAYCGKSTLYLGAAAVWRDAYIYSIDHHSGSPEHQPGQPFYDPVLRTGPSMSSPIDTLAEWRTNILKAQLEDYVIGIVGDSQVVGRTWQWSPAIKLLFIDGAHEEEAVTADYLMWSGKLHYHDGYLLLHDVDPGMGPYEVWKRALTDGFAQVAEQGSLKVLSRR